MFWPLRPVPPNSKPPLGVRVDAFHPLAPYTAWLFNEGAGTLLNEAGNGDPSVGFHGGGPTWKPAQGNGGYGPVLSFASASSQWVDLAVISAGFSVQNPRGIVFAGTNNTPATWTILFRTTIAAGTTAELYSNLGTGGPTGAVQVLFTANPTQTRFSMTDNSSVTNSVSPVVAASTDGKWHMVHSVNQGAGRNLILYIDGVNKGSTANTMSSSITFGRERVGAGSGGSGSAFFNGDVGFLMTWNRALSAAEVRSHYSNPFQSFLPTRPLQPTLLPATAVIDRRTANFRSASRTARGGS